MALRQNVTSTGTKPQVLSLQSRQQSHQPTGQLALPGQNFSAWPYFPGNDAGRCSALPRFPPAFPLAHGHLKHLQLLPNFGPPHSSVPSLPTEQEQQIRGRLGTCQRAGSCLHHLLPRNTSGAGLSPFTTQTRAPVQLQGDAGKQTVTQAAGGACG